MHIIGNNKKLPDTKTYQNQYRVFGDKAIIFTTKASNGTYNFRMWIPEEQLYYRKSLRTKLLSDALTLAEQEVLSLLTKLKNGHKIAGSSWGELCKLFLEKKQKEVETGRITKGRLVTIRSQVLSHIIPYIGDNVRLNELDRFKFQEYGRVCEIKCVNGHSFLSCKKEKDYGQKERTDSRQPEGADRPADPGKRRTSGPV